ncbi:hypothetical protein CERZMDRAFT_87274 [Cercospora zeae-maydis SCOH1-5]|uniref:Uncharacterized protein n=1 Tax=Cercospora zeae-maydis SCOH1-5 TaxID=717836 RepID=A0A6A6F5A0_9PEZI|nr:hypothetical protein CERZMDRAFT_87274 [Cercospora zeae-maydis SCOH1-5]
MANTDLIIPLTVAALGLIGTIASLLWSWYLQERTATQTRHLQHETSQQALKLDTIQKRHEHQLAEHKSRTDQQLETLKLTLERRKVAENLTEKYSPPLLVAAYDLQQRLFELVEYPISRQHVSTQEGVEDLKIFTCYLLAQYIVYAWILRTKTGYLSFARDARLKNLRNAMYMIDQELDQRRDEVGDGANVGAWPGARYTIAERMVVAGSRRDVNELLDGGFGLEVKGYDQFLVEWKENFRLPMGVFCQWIDDMLEGRVKRLEHRDAALRCLQHLLVDLVMELDVKAAYIPEDEGRRPKCNASSRGCDCQSCSHQKKDLNAILKERQDCRYVEDGIWNVNGLRPRRTKGSHYVDKAGKEFELDMVKALTSYEKLY